jgi:hypothetical protein
VGDKQLDLAIENNRIVGQSGGEEVLSGQDLLGAEILLDTTDADDPSPAYKIRIDRVRPETFAFPLGTPEPVELYVFSWSKVAGPGSDEEPPPDASPPPDVGTIVDTPTPADDGALPDASPPPDVGTIVETPLPVDPPTAADAGTIAPSQGGSRNLCSNPPYYLMNPKYNPPQDPTHHWVMPPAFSELLNMKPDEALVFAGDRIDARQKTMSDTADPLWFNIGCAGHALSKLFMTRNTLASTPPAGFLPPTWAMRQATLKLLAADYCGTGTPFTVAGQLLNWTGYSKEAKGGYYATPVPKSIEAHWNENGAICLTEPRVESSDLPEARLEFPDVREAIKAECRRALPACSAVDERSLPGLRVSAITYPLPEPTPPRLGPWSRFAPGSLRRLMGN